MVAQRMVRQSSFLALAIHDSGMGSTVAGLSRVVEALAGMRLGLEYPYFWFTDYDGIYFCMTMPPNPAFESGRAHKRRAAQRERSTDKSTRESGHSVVLDYV